MTFQVALLPRHLLRAGIVAFVAIGASGCSSVPNWVDPTNWIGGSDDQTATPDQTAQTPDAQAPDAQTSDNGQTPDLSTIPDKPNAPSTADEQRQVSQTLQSDRARTQYSSDALKGGTEPAAAAPPPPDVVPANEDVASNGNGAPAPKPATAPPPQPGRSSAPGTLPSDNDAAPAAPPPTEVASTETPPPAVGPSAMPAVPAAPALAANQPTPTDATLGFRPSSAPPLDASVAQFVPASILARYRQTASMGPPAAVPSSVSAPDNSEMASNLVTSGPKSRRRTHATGMGGPESMSGAVVANFDALQAGGAPLAADGFTGSPAAVVFFASDRTVLSADAIAQIQSTARAFMAQGAQGYVRVIGHSSGRIGSMSAERFLVWNFEHSQARANAVARALIKAGVPADKVLVQAAGDSESAYQGGDGNRRAEIFFQS